MKSDYDEEAENDIAATINGAADYEDTTVSAKSNKPRLHIDDKNPDETVTRVRDILAAHGNFYDRGKPTIIFRDPTTKCSVFQHVGTDRLIIETHKVCRPFRRNNGTDSATFETDIKLPRDFAGMYLSMDGEWGLRPLHGISSAPLARDDGSITCCNGYDLESGLWCENIPDLSGLIPEHPTHEDAQRALKTLRDHFKTFCFADAQLQHDAELGLPIVDLGTPPGNDESSFLAFLQTAVLRPSLPTSPGILIKSAANSGSGSGKGLIVRCVCAIAYGRQPTAVTAGRNGDELEKRLGAILISGEPIVFLDNLNARELRSDLLASALTEPSARIRILGKTEMAQINSAALIVLNGNGLSVSEDLARRFITIEFDAGLENPEARQFPYDIRSEIARRRPELLAAALTVWRWGQQQPSLPRGLPLGSFDDWCRWVRDPLLALGCQDPVKRVQETKALDTRRDAVKELFEIWSMCHGTAAVRASELHEDVKNILDPQQRGRQYIASRLKSLSGTRMAGFVLTLQPPTGKWGAVTYALREAAEHTPHRVHRDHREKEGYSRAPVETRPFDTTNKGCSISKPPMPPMTHEAHDFDAAPPKFKMRI